MESYELSKYKNRMHVEDFFLQIQSYIEYVYVAV